MSHIARFGWSFRPSQCPEGGQGKRSPAEARPENVTIDWILRENVRAHLRGLVKRVLRRYDHLPDKQEKVTRTVLEQADIGYNIWGSIEGSKNGENAGLTFS